MGPAHPAERGWLARSRLGGPTAQLALRRETFDGTMTVTEWAPPNVLGFDVRDGPSRVTA
jgi:hypothetical protein